MEIIKNKVRCIFYDENGENPQDVLADSTGGERYVIYKEHRYDILPRHNPPYYFRINCRWSRHFDEIKDK